MVVLHIYISINLDFYNNIFSNAKIIYIIYMIILLGMPKSSTSSFQELFTKLGCIKNIKSVNNSL